MKGQGRYLASWSGGKDSCFACHRATQKGMAVSRLVHFHRPENLHGVPQELIELQAGLTGIPLISRKASSDDFEKTFTETVRPLVQEGAAGMVFGDIHLEPHREWIERVCSGLGIEAVFPLWGADTEELLREFLSEGFETIVVSGRENLFDKEWIGKKIDGGFIPYLKAKGLDACGENGEYHTFVVAGPLFRGRMELVRDGITRRDGHWFMNIRSYRVNNR